MPAGSSLGLWARFVALDYTARACLVASVVAALAGFAAACVAEGIRYPNSDSIEVRSSSNAAA